MTDEQPPEDLGHAGAVVDKAIEYMVAQNIGALSIASALLGGALALLARSVADEAIVQILNNAIASVRSGELRGADGGTEDTRSSSQPFRVSWKSSTGDAAGTSVPLPSNRSRRRRCHRGYARRNFPRPWRGLVS